MGSCYRLESVSQVFLAKVQGGVIVPEDVDLPEGSVVTIVTDDEGDELSPEDEAELLEAMAELDRGEGIPFEDVLREIDSIRPSK